MKKTHIIISETALTESKNSQQCRNRKKLSQSDKEYL